MSVTKVREIYTTIIAQKTLSARSAADRRAGSPLRPVYRVRLSASSLFTSSMNVRPSREVGRLTFVTL